MNPPKPINGILNWSLIFQLAANFGVPSVIVLIGGWWVARYVATPLVESHITFLAGQTASMNKMAIILERMETADAERTKELFMNRTEILAVGEAVKGVGQDAVSGVKQQVELLQEISDERMKQRAVAEEQLVLLKEISKKLNPE